jgi:hypothetical protein
MRAPMSARRRFPQASPSASSAASPYGAFAALFALLCLAAAGSARFVLDDWCQIGPLADMFQGGGGGWAALLDNRWSPAPRVYFLTYMLKAAFAALFGLSSALPYYAPPFAAHLCSSLLIRRLLRGAGLPERTASAAGLAALVCPTSTAALMWINGWNFILPVAAVLGFAVLREKAARQASDAPKTAGLLTALALVAQFLGDQTLPLLYAAHAWALLDAWRRKGEPGHEARLAVAAVPAAACVLALALYAPKGVLPHLPKESAAWTAGGLLKTLSDLAYLHLDALNPWGRYLGAGTVAPSAATLALTAAAALALYLRLPRETASAQDETAAAPTSPLWAAAAAAAAAWLLCQLVTAAGLLGGARAYPEPRYAYAGGLALGVLLALSAEALRRADARLGAAAQPVLLIALSGLSFYSARDLWGGQKRLDERLWAQVDAQLSPDKAFVLTDGMTPTSLLLQLSNAVSDFKDEFGVSCRLRSIADFKDGPYVTRRYQKEYDLGKTVLLSGYRGEVYEAPKERCVPLVLRHGPTLAEQLAAKPTAFKDFEDYRRFREADPTPLTPWKLRPR